MIVIKDKIEMRKWSREQRSQGHTIGFVPTMGYLHGGHLSLVKTAKGKADVVVVSIYVNPTQFAAHEDFDVYPRNIDRDREQLRSAGVAVSFEPDTLYAPPPGPSPGTSLDNALVVDAAEYTPGQHDTFVVPEHLQRPLCGRSRPHFFRGVATIVTKLFNLVDPDIAVFGKKDYQQWRIIVALARDLDYAIEVVGADIERESDGLAASSRNTRLTDTSRADAVCVSAALQWAAMCARSGTCVADVVAGVTRRIEERGGEVDYVEIVDSEFLGPLEVVNAGTAAVIAAAARFAARGGGQVRLIDNVVL